MKRNNTNAFVKGMYYENINDDVKQIQFDAKLDYGKKPQANVLLDVYDNGRERHFDINLDKTDIENLLQLPTVDKPIEQRLIDDFNVENKRDIRFMTPQLVVNKLSPKKYRKTPLPLSGKYTHLSSPLEEILLPLSVRKTSSKSSKSKSSKRSSKKRSNRNSKRTPKKSKTKTRKSSRQSSSILFN
jgi:hypothetical protein